MVGWLVYDRLLTTLSEPLLALSRRRGGGLVQLNFAGVTTAFSLKLKVALFVGVILASPVWLYQVWAFIVPGLTRREKRTAMAFVAAAVPLFLGGLLPGDVGPAQGRRGAARVHPGTAPRTCRTPATTSTSSPGSSWPSAWPSCCRSSSSCSTSPTCCPARVMLKGWRVAVMLIFVFAAMMTPTPDAWTMLALAFPMIALYFGAVGVAALVDRRRHRDEPDWSGLSDDEASTL